MMNKSVYIGGPLRIKKYRSLKKYETIAEIIRSLGLMPYLPHFDTGDPEANVDEKQIYKRNIAALDRSILAIFDITNPSHGVGMEIQHALTKKIPFFCVCEKGAILSKMVTGALDSKRIIYYEDLNESWENIAKKTRQYTGLKDEKRKIYNH